MHLPEWLRKTLLRRAHKIAASRAPDFIIGGEENPYLRRWWLIPRNRWFNVYLHHFMRSDDDRALHDHPWRSWSVLLDGAYYEYVPREVDGGFFFDQQIKYLDYQNPVAILRMQGSINGRKLGQDAHRVELIKTSKGEELPVWTIFITGPKRREWGFYCLKGWRHWREFCDPRDHGRAGPGCN